MSNLWAIIARFDSNNSLFYFLLLSHDQMEILDERKNNLDGILYWAIERK